MRQTKVKALRRYWKANETARHTWKQMKKAFHNDKNISVLIDFLGYQGKAWHERNEIL